MSKRGEYAAAAEVEADEKKPGQKRAFMEGDAELSGLRDKVHADNRHPETVAGLLESIQGIRQTEELVRRRYMSALDRLMHDTDALASADAGERRSYWENIVDFLLRQMRELQALREADLRQLGMVEAPPSLHSFPPAKSNTGGWGQSGAGGGGWGGSS